MIQDVELQLQIVETLFRSCNSSIGKLVRKQWNEGNPKLMGLVGTIRSGSFQAVSVMNLL